MKTAGIVAAPAVISAQTVTNAIKVGLVGAGGRGTGAAAQAMKADDYSELTAVADVSLDQINNSLTRIARAAGPRGVEKVKVLDTNKYLGYEAFQKVIDSDIDVVILATPPGFRPYHLRYAVEKKRHIFCEKPMAVCPTGIRHVLETVRMSKQNDRSLVAGFQWRYTNYLVDLFDKLHNGIIGDVVAYYATYYSSPVKPIPPGTAKPASMSDVEWQTLWWYNFMWTCGGGYVEQAVHSVDKVAWAMKDQPPISCVSNAGRAYPAEAGTNIHDHIQANYLYPNGVRATIAHRHFVGCHNENADYILGTKGKITIGKGPWPRVEDHQGKSLWSYEGQKNDPYQYEHDVLFQAVRKGQVVNNGDRMISSTALAILGRLAGDTGAEVTWDQLMNSKESTFPEPFDPKGNLPVVPVAVPGFRKLV